MKITLLSSSQRKNSNSLKVSSFLAEEIKKTDASCTCEILDLATLGLPFWDDRMWEAGPNPLKEIWLPISKKLKESDGFIIISPEWNGMSPAALHNLFLYCSDHELTHKPALIASVSAGIGGPYPVSELRMIGYKNTRLCYLPEHLIFRNVVNFLDEEMKEDRRNMMMRTRTKGTLELLLNYTKAFQTIRKNDRFDYKTFPSGM